MFKKIIQKQRKQKNTQEIKYISLLEEKNLQDEKMINLQDKVIRLQDEIKIKNEELLAAKEKEITELKNKITNRRKKNV